MFVSHDLGSGSLGLMDMELTRGMSSVVVWQPVDAVVRLCGALDVAWWEFLNSLMMSLCSESWHCTDWHSF